MQHIAEAPCAHACLYCRKICDIADLFCDKCDEEYRRIIPPDFFNFYTKYLSDGEKCYKELDDLMTLEEEARKLYVYIRYEDRKEWLKIRSEFCMQMTSSIITMARDIVKLHKKAKNAGITDEPSRPR